MSIALNQHAAQVALQQPISPGYLPRSKFLPLPFAVPAVLTGLSMMMGGSPVLTDLGFVSLTALCTIGLAGELVRFPRRFGIGGIVLFGGVLIWFCYDYLTHWLGADFSNPNVALRPAVVARSAFCHCLFILLMTVGLLIPFGRRFVRLFHLIPEPSNRYFYAGILLLLFCVGISPYFLFTSDPWYRAIWQEMTGGRTGGAAWQVGRSGNVNYSWGGYLATLLQVGQVGGQLAVFYAVLVARTGVTKLIGWSIWSFWLALAFGSGTRGNLVFMALPGIALLYLKYQAHAAVLLKSVNKRAYFWAGGLLVALLFAVQFQAYFRTTSYAGADVSTVSLSQLRGTGMFSAGLLGYHYIPRDADFFYSRFPGESVLRPLPQTVYEFAVGPVPRALWRSKPIDPVWAWYNAVSTGSEQGLEGTTIAQGLVGGWYFRYGLAGVIQGGLLLGWLMRIAERALQTSQGRSISILLSLAFATWLFRSFRLLNFHELYPLLIGAAGLWILVRFDQALSRVK